MAMDQYNHMAIPFEISICTSSETFSPNRDSSSEKIKAKMALIFLACKNSQAPQ
jgi:hypothetical protein